MFSLCSSLREFCRRAFLRNNIGRCFEDCRSRMHSCSCRFFRLRKNCMLFGKLLRWRGFLFLRLSRSVLSRFISVKAKTKKFLPKHHKSEYVLERYLAFSVLPKKIRPNSLIPYCIFSLLYFLLLL